MKTLKTILLVLAVLSIAVNALAYLGTGGKIPKGKGDDTVAYFIGYNSFFILGGVLLLSVYFIGKKIKKKERKKMVDSLLK